MPNLKRPTPPHLVQPPAPPKEKAGKPQLYFLAELMEEKRRELGLTQKQLAERAYLTQAQVSDLEVSDGTKVPRGDSLYWLAKALHLNMEHLVSEHPPE